MPKLEASFAEVPDAYVKLKPAIYTFRITKVEVVPSKNPETLTKDPNAKNIELECIVVTPGEFEGRKTGRTLSTKMLTECKRLWLSAGVSKEQIEKEGCDTDLLPGKDFRGIVKANSYKDATTGVMKENTRLEEFLIPGDAGYAG